MFRFIMAVAIFIWLACGVDGRLSWAQSEPLPIDVDLELASSYFEELRILGEKDDGRLWGVSLLGPALFVAPSSRMIVANMQIPGDSFKLKQHGRVFVGTLPSELPIANTSIHWAEQDWTMLLWPLPTDPTDRRVLLSHESWHRVQSKIPLSSSGAANSHLDSISARICLQMEWQALAKALENEGEKRRDAIVDALVFRSIRRQRFSNAAKEENSMELHEGMAEYTGIRLGASDNAASYAIDAMRSRPENWSSFVRSFAYLSGPGYGLLLDEHDEGWRMRLHADSDLGEMLRRALNLELPKSLPDHARTCIVEYQAVPLIDRERVREAKRLDNEKRLKAIFQEGPVLILPLGKMQMSFDPSRNVPLENSGTVYGNLVVSDSWGKLSSTGEAMISSDFRQLTVPLEVGFSTEHLQGKDWALDLASGWIVKESEEKGKWALEQSK